MEGQQHIPDSVQNPGFRVINVRVGNASSLGPIAEWPTWKHTNQTMFVQMDMVIVDLVTIKDHVQYEVRLHAENTSRRVVSNLVLSTNESTTERHRTYGVVPNIHTRVAWTWSGLPPRLFDLMQQMLLAPESFLHRKQEPELEYNHPDWRIIRNWQAELFTGFPELMFSLVPNMYLHYMRWIEREPDTDFF